MDEWSMMDDDESGETFFGAITSKDQSLFIKFLQLFDEQGTPRKKKKRSDEEDIGSYYNVGVYRVLPYPPNTKDAKDFFVQRTS
jgi:hypothetical protein